VKPPAPPPVFVIVADDHPVVRSGVRLLLSRARGFDLVAETSDAASTLAALERQPPHILVLDLWMGGNDGFDLLRQVHARWPEVRILVYSMNDERVFGPRALHAGAAAYVMKTEGLDQLLAALRLVAGGGRYMSPTLAAELAEAALHAVSQPRKPAALATLTDRELQILRLIGTGHSTAFIAETLHISPKTVGAHRENLKNKLALDDGAELTRRAVQLVETHVL
jgi:DNA-binding NarL/FixJ family response regulator